MIKKTFSRQHESFVFVKSIYSFCQCWSLPLCNKQASMGHLLISILFNDCNTLELQHVALSVVKYLLICFPKHLEHRHAPGVHRQVCLLGTGHVLQSRTRWQVSDTLCGLLQVVFKQNDDFCLDIHIDETYENTQDTAAACLCVHVCEREERKRETKRKKKWAYLKSSWRVMARLVSGSMA